VYAATTSQQGGNKIIQSIMACVSYCSSGLLDHSLIDCDEYKLGGISQLVIGACGTALTDPSSGTEIEALLTAGTAKLVQNVRMALPAGSPVTVDSPVGCGTTIRINEDRTATMFDANVLNDNVEFYNSLNGDKVAWMLMYLCDSDKVVYVNPPQGIVTSAQFIIPEQNNELQRFESTFSWRDKNIPLQYDAPVGIFE
jgi:hypothetical protein